VSELDNMTLLTFQINEKEIHFILEILT